MSDTPLLHLALPAPRLPRRSRSARTSGMISAALHVLAAALAAVLTFGSPPSGARREMARPVPEPMQAPRMVFLQMPGPGGGGGGGGNRQWSPPSRARSVGSDRIALRVAHPVRAEREPQASTDSQLVVLHAVPLLSGKVYQVGMPQAPSSLASSLGPGVGGGAGDGAGTGIGSGTGPGLGPGSGGGLVAAHTGRATV